MRESFPSLLLPMRTALLVGITALSLLIAGCAAESAPPSPDTPATNADEEAPDAKADDSAGTGTFTVGGRVFTVDLTMCAMYDNGDEIVLAGLASEQGSSAQGFLEGDLLRAGTEMNAEFRVDIDAVGPMQSTDEFLALGYASGTPVTLDGQDGGYVIRSGGWNENGDDLGAASLAFSCRQ